MSTDENNRIYGSSGTEQGESLDSSSVPGEASPTSVSSDVPPAPAREASVFGIHKFPRAEFTPLRSSRPPSAPVRTPPPAPGPEQAPPPEPVAAPRPVSAPVSAPRPAPQPESAPPPATAPVPPVSSQTFYGETQQASSSESPYRAPIVPPTPPTPPPPRRKKRFPKVLLVLLILAAMAPALYFGLPVLKDLLFHEHVWINATCTEPLTCIDCGETAGDPLEHIWNAATCTEPETCTRCAMTTGAPHGHEWQTASCSAPKTCLHCGEEDGEALGHDWIEADYETPRTCRICRETQGEPLEHEWVYLNELEYASHYGKVWTMSEETPDYYADPDITDEAAYWNESVPGHVTGPVYDYLGNRYTYGLCVDGLDFSEYEVSYYLNGEYETFSGYISMTGDAQWNAAASTGKYFELYGDGKLLYRSPTMTNYLSAQEFSVDVSGVNYLTIRYPRTSGPSRMATIYDGMLS